MSKNVPKSPGEIDKEEFALIDDSEVLLLNNVKTESENQKILKESFTRLRLELEREIWERAGILLGSKTVKMIVDNEKWRILFVMSKIKVDKTLYDAVNDFKQSTVNKLASSIRDGIYLVLKGEGQKLEFFGGWHADKMGEDKIDAYLENIKSEDEFKEFSLLEQREEDRKILEEWVEKENGALLEELRFKDDCIIVMALLPHPDKKDADEILHMICKGRDPDPVKFGGKYSWRLSPNTIEAYLPEIINTKNFAQVSDMVEGVLEEMEKRMARLKRDKNQ